MEDKCFKLNVLLSDKLITFSYSVTKIKEKEKKYQANSVPALGFLENNGRI